MNCRTLTALAVLCLSFATALPARAQNYKNFRVAIYVTRDTVAQWADPQRLQQAYDSMVQQVKFDKVYLEFATARRINDEATLDPIIKFFTHKGILVSGATALNGGGAQGRDAGNASLSYANPADREYVTRVAQTAARHFDEMILDDWFFTGAKTPADIAAKGDRSWTQYRLDTMNDVALNDLIKPAKAINPRIQIIIKYPNWYEHYQALGYDLDQEPKLFDAIYTGVETRDPVFTEQHLQQYESYQIGRYLENVKPGNNDGSWVDTLQTQYIDRYAEQVWDMAFARPKEITLWQWNDAASRIAIGDRPWEKLNTSFSYQKMLDSYKGNNQPTNGLVAGCALQQADAVLSKVGKPMGLAACRPPHAIGEEFLYDYLGMCGIPIDLHPAFPSDADTVLLTEGAKYDSDLVPKIKAHLMDGKNVIITSGLLHALTGKGIEDISEFEYTDHKFGATQFQGRGGRPIAGAETLTDPIYFPVIHFITNQSWAQVNGLDGYSPQNGYPLLLTDVYGKGTLFVLVIPDNPADLYRLPPSVLGTIRAQIMGNFPVRLNDAPGQVALFVYDNDSFVVESYLPGEATITVSVAGSVRSLTDLTTGDSLSPAQGGGGGRRGRGQFGGSVRTTFSMTIPPHSFRAFSASSSVAQGTPPSPATLRGVDLPNTDTYLNLARDADANLKDQILANWYPRARDPNGGFLQNFNEDWSPGRGDSKGVVYESRLTWMAAQAAAHFPNQAATYTAEARHGLDFLANKMWDAKNGGFFWAVDDNGNPSPGPGGNAGASKQAYGNGFAIFAAAEVYRLTKDPAALELAKRGFQWYDQHGHDAANGGYYEILNQDGTVDTLNSAAVGGGPNTKSMNSTIHMLEALTSLYEVWPDPMVKSRLQESFLLNRDKIAVDSGYLIQYFSLGWQPRQSDDSYGHDVETAYLLTEAATALGIPDDPRAWEVGKKLVDHAIAVGWDKTNGGLYNSGNLNGGNYSDYREWWVEAEFLNALLLMHEHYGKEVPIYWTTFNSQWNWINNFGVDRDHHGWWPRVSNDGDPIHTAKSDSWTECYHQGRAMISVTTRLRRLAENLPRQ